MNDIGRGRVKQVIGSVRARSCRYGVHTAADPDSGGAVLTFIVIEFADRRRPAFECPVRGEFLAAGLDFVVMLDGDSYRIYDESVRPLATVPVAAGSFCGCEGGVFLLRLENGQERVFDRRGVRTGGARPGLGAGAGGGGLLADFLRRCWRAAGF